MKKDQANENRPSTTQGKPKKVAEAPFRDQAKEQPSKEPLFPSQKKAISSEEQVKINKIQTPIDSKPQKNELIKADTDQKKAKPNNLSARKPLKQQEISTAFKDSMIEGVGIYVNYSAPEDDIPERESSNPIQEDLEQDRKPVNDQPNPNQLEEEKQEDDEACDENDDDVRIQHNQNTEKEVTFDRNGRYDNEQDLEYDEGEEISIQRNVLPSNGDHTPVTGTHRTEIDAAEIDYNPHSFRQLRHPDLDYEEVDYRNLGHRSLDYLKLQNEYSQHQKIIEYQNARIEGLMHQINSLSSNLNIVLSKAACLEQNVYQLTYQAQKPLFPQPGLFNSPGPFIQNTPLIAYPSSSFLANQGTSMGTSFHSPRTMGAEFSQPQLGGYPLGTGYGSFSSLTSPAEEIEQVRRQIALKSKEISEWQQKRADEERLMKDKLARMEYVKRETLQPDIDTTKKKKTAGKITGENIIDYRERENDLPKPPSKPEIPKFKKKIHGKTEASQPDPQYQHSNRQFLTEEDRISFSNQKFESLPYSISPSHEPQFHKPHSESDNRARAQQLKLRAAKTMNATLARILEDNEYRRLLDFLADKENLKNIGMINLEILELLIQKVTDMLSYKAEAYVEECLPWIATLLHTPGLVSLSAAQDLLYVVKMVLGTDKRRKLYQHHIVVELQQLQVDLEDQVSSLQKYQLAPRVY